MSYSVHPYCVELLDYRIFMQLMHPFSRPSELNKGNCEYGREKGSKSSQQRYNRDRSVRSIVTGEVTDDKWLIII